MLMVPSGGGPLDIGCTTIVRHFPIGLNPPREIAGPVDRRSPMPRLCLERSGGPRYRARPSGAAAQRGKTLFIGKHPQDGRSLASAH
jgi:hypothetical protein